MERMDRTAQSAFDALFYPRAVAVVGASTHGGKVGNFVMRSLLASDVEKVYPVHAGGAKEILGRQAYPSIEDIPDDAVDLFLFAIPQKHILKSFEAALTKGCRGAVIYTAGFREAGEEGRRDQERLKAAADEAGVKIIGPNTLGFFRSHSLMNATFMPVLSDLFREPGSIALVSQSGGVAGFGAIRFAEDRIPLGTLVCLGNRANVEFADMLDYLAYDPHTRVVALFIEGLDDLRRFYEAALKCAAVKPVVVLGAGYTEAGRKVARSHTGSMAGAERIYEAAFRQAGLIRVHSIEELVDAAKILSLNPLPQGNRVGIITHTAGPAVLASDILARHGLVLADISGATEEALVSRGVLAPFMPPDNPVDLTTFGYLDRSLYVKVLEILARDAGVDAALAVCMSGLGDPNVETFPARQFGEVAARSGKPVVVAWGAPGYAREEFDAWMEAGVAAYPTPERAATALANLYRSSRLRGRRRSFASPLEFPEELSDFVEDLRSSGNKILLEHQAKRMLELAGIRTAHAVLVSGEDEAASAAREIGYPVVLKIASPDIVHKSDVGGVVLNITDEEALRRAYRYMMETVARKAPDARLEGVCVQPMVPTGTDLIVGGIRDVQAGPVVMFGLGGIWVEAIGDVAFRLAPVTEEDAREMMEEIRASAVLEGIRGSAPVNRDALARLIVTVSHLMECFSIQELDCNPVIFHNGTFTVADARVVL
ncbi:acetate--CoA ligase family protein [Thermodesulforhabdus norvegica]|uniref:Acetyltransferase n=1 Tax=Thermodesulforhabdus norvegica TaxID=39841 RepID=A0A1I4VTM4_9BACT|nr:acetate--CoA ligase family protein [Thermodesulforhabdus norvegica]SFN04624.1 acetyltransferase [Thermodesulforhabdus norvegica]